MRYQSSRLISTLKASRLLVKETAEKALRMASQALPTLTSHRVKLDRLEDDVSCLHADFDGLQSPPDHTLQIDLLEADVSRIDAAVEELRTQIRTAMSAPDTSTVTRDNAGMQRTTPDDTAALPLETAPMGDTACMSLKHPPKFDNTDTLPSENTQGPTQMSGFCNPLFPNAYPYYSQPRETAASRRVPQGDYPRMNRIGPRSKRMAVRSLVVHLSTMAIPIMSVTRLLMNISDCTRRMMIL